MADAADREWLQAAGWAVFGLLFLAGLLALLREALRTVPAPPLPMETVITQVTLPPPPPPPPPRRLTPQPVSLPRPVAAPSRPQRPLRLAARPLALAPAIRPTPYIAPPGADQGIVVGGDSGTGEGACGGRDYYSTVVVSQLRSAILRNETQDGRSFHVQARLWFESTGQLREAQLVHSTGDAGLDAEVRRLLAAIAVGAGMPACLQPIQVWVTEPWETWLGGTSETQTYQTQQGPRHDVQQRMETRQY